VRDIGADADLDPAIVPRVPLLGHSLVSSERSRAIMVKQRSVRADVFDFLERPQV
jgi:hypothetical protein